jgi:serine/threonine protein kinase
VLGSYYFDHAIVFFFSKLQFHSHWLDCDGADGFDWLEQNHRIPRRVHDGGAADRQGRPDGTHHELVDVFFLSFFVVLILSSSSSSSSSWLLFVLFPIPWSHLEALSAVAHIHSLNIIHRDVKSDNLLLNSTGDIKLADFGLSREVDSANQKRKSLVGTPYWMAPVCDGREKC